MLYIIRMFPAFDPALPSNKTRTEPPSFQRQSVRSLRPTRQVARHGFVSFCVNRSFKAAESDINRVFDCIDTGENQALFGVGRHQRQTGTGWLPTIQLSLL